MIGPLMKVSVLLLQAREAGDPMREHELECFAERAGLDRDQVSPHDLLQGQGNRETDWVHAYLHRKEGDKANANYWYSRAGRSMPNTSLEAEWDDIVAALL